MPAPSHLMAILARSPSDRPRRPPPRCRRRRPRFRERNRRGSGVHAYGYLRWEWKQHCEQEHGRGRRIDSSEHLGAGVAPTCYGRQNLLLPVHCRFQGHGRRLHLQPSSLRQGDDRSRGCGCASAGGGRYRLWSDLSNDAKSYPNDSFDNMRQFASTHGMPFPRLHDEEQSAARAYGAVCTPDFFGYDGERGLKYQRSARRRSHHASAL